jgi:hypothetical protein
MVDYGEILSKYPHFLNAYHLVELGLFPSTDAAYLARVRGHTPPFLKMGRKVLYPTVELIKWLNENSCAGSVAKTT